MQSMDKDELDEWIGYLLKCCRLDAFAMSSFGRGFWKLPDKTVRDIVIENLE